MEQDLEGERADHGHPAGPDGATGQAGEECKGECAPEPRSDSSQGGVVPPRRRVAHQGAVDGHRGDSLDRYPRFRDTLHQLFVQQNVTCVFEGHEHLYNRQERDGVVYVITGGGGAPLYANELKGGFYHYLRVDVTATGYTVAVKRL